MKINFSTVKPIMNQYISPKITNNPTFGEIDGSLTDDYPDYYSEHDKKFQRNLSNLYWRADNCIMTNEQFYEEYDRLCQERDDANARDGIKRWWEETCDDDDI